ncbi:hypothetical protein B296_00037142 [Ensete ventricosum]|uniref:Uncharacterized protein n=1 Tax=Ensete ventricosum TaxID=4639 RepID=A0A427A0C7_ENSVE|nr:hypothetical protein B296_00037142 [Ensete ventricosum]
MARYRYRYCSGTEMNSVRWYGPVSDPCPERQSDQFILTVPYQLGRYNKCWGLCTLQLQICMTSGGNSLSFVNIPKN